jgi:death-on-curing protein
MIEFKEVEKIHDILVEKFGGTKGIRDRGALELAINRPYQTFDGNDLYPEPADKGSYF